MTSQEVDEGLVLPYVAQAVAGKGGAAALLLVIFMVCILYCASILCFPKINLNVGLYFNLIRANDCHELNPLV
jgi:Na+/proline symporter